MRNKAGFFLLTAAALAGIYTAGMPAAAACLGRTGTAYMLQAGQSGAADADAADTDAADIDAADTDPDTEAEDEPEGPIRITNALLKIDGRWYYFDKNGKTVKKTRKKVNGNYYYFDAKGRAVTEKWKTLDGSRYYFKKNGTAAAGSCKINGKYYVFSTKGKLLTPKKTSLKRSGADYYYINSKGNPVSGWHVLNRKSMYDADVIYVRKNGKCARKETVDGIKFASNARAADSGQALARITAQNYIKRHTLTGDSKEVKLKKCARRIVGYFAYTIDRYCRGFDKDDWVYRAAVEGLETESGDCYYAAASIGAVADALGYKNVSVIHLTKSHAYVRIGTKGNYVYYDNMGPVYGGPSPRFPKAEVKRVFTF